MKSKILKCTILMLLLCFIIVGSASAEGVTNPMTQSSSSFDINNDGKVDTISVTQPNASNEYRGRLYINGIKAYEFPPKRYMEYCGYRVITLQNNEKFILLTAEGFNPGISDDVLLQYTKSGEIKKIISLHEAVEKFGMGNLLSNRTEIGGGIIVIGNTVIFNYEKMLWTTGGITLVFKYVYKGETLKRVSYKGEIADKETFITSRKISTFKSPNGKAKSITFKNKTKVYLKNYYLKGNKMWLRFVDSSGKGGWIKCLTKNPGTARSPLFADGYYAG